MASDSSPLVRRKIQNQRCLDEKLEQIKKTHMKTYRQDLCNGKFLYPYKHLFLVRRVDKKSARDLSKYMNNAAKASKSPLPTKSKVKNSSNTQNPTPVQPKKLIKTRFKENLQKKTSQKPELRKKNISSATAVPSPTKRIKVKKAQYSRNGMATGGQHTHRSDKENTKFKSSRSVYGMK